MRLTELIDRVERRGRFARPGQAERAVCAVVETLGETLGPEERRELAEHLPRELQAPLRRYAGKEEDLSPEEFRRRVGERREASADEAVDPTPVVLQVLQESAGGALDSWLPEEFQGVPQQEK